MIFSALLLSQIVEWEILLEHRNLCPWEGGKRMVLLDSALVIANYALRDTNPLAVPFITSVDTGGNILWEVSLSSGDLAEPGWEIAEKIASDSPFVYVAGARFRENIPILNSLVHRVDLAGNILWSTGPKPSIWTGCASDVMTDPSGNLVYVGLQYDPLYCSYNIYLSSWDREGNQRWEIAYDYSHDDDFPLSACLDEQMDIYVGGCGGRPSCPNQIPIAMKVDRNGNLVWVKDFYEGFGNHTGYIQSVRAKNGALTVMGWACSGGIFVGKYRYDGSEIWSVFLNPQEFLEGEDMIVDDEYQYVSGFKDKNQFFALALDNQGQLLWETAIPSDTGFRGNKIVLDSLGNLFVGGYIFDAAGRREFTVAKLLASDGAMLWVYKRDNDVPGYDGDECLDLIPDQKGGVYALGRLWGMKPDPKKPCLYLAHIVDTTGDISEGAQSSQGLVLTPAPSGFLISGYEGEAQVYDPAGRLILTREIKGKALIGPLKPGVYFVVAGSQRAKVAVR